MNRFTWALLALLMLAVPALSAQNQPSGQGRWQPPPPPRSWTAQEHHGYMDGIDAAWLDLADKLPASPARHMQYKNPPGVPIARQGLYRTGFRKGYQAIYDHQRKAIHAENTGPK